jgi:hypothetical protein
MLRHCWPPTRGNSPHKYWICATLFLKAIAVLTSEGAVDRSSEADAMSEGLSKRGPRSKVFVVIVSAMAGREATR